MGLFSAAGSWLDFISRRHGTCDMFYAPIERMKLPLVAGNG